MPDATHLPVDAPLAAYEQQASELLAAFRAGDERALNIFRESHPRFLDPVVTWKPLDLSDDAVRAAALTDDDARLAVARAYTFRDWEALAHTAGAIATHDSPTRDFELAVEAVIDGDENALAGLLHRRPALVAARSGRVTCQDPPVHGATLLHYVAANGVEGYRQRSPANAVAIATMLLDAGAEVDALAGMYGGEYPTLSMLASSSPPHERGVQRPLVELLLDRGAAPGGRGSEQWKSPLATALVFGFLDVAKAIAERVGDIDDLAIVAALGRHDDTKRLLPLADEGQRHRALALAAINDRVAEVRLLLEAGVDPNRFNPEGMHAHQTPLHGAALSGHVALAGLLLEFGARLDTLDTLWNATPAAWAKHGNQPSEHLERAADRE